MALLSRGESNWGKSHLERGFRGVLIFWTKSPLERIGCVFGVT